MLEKFLKKIWALQQFLNFEKKYNKTAETLS